MIDLLALVKKRYPSPEYAVLGQVRNQTGYATKLRTADAIAMGTYPSRGLLLHGFEFKADRGDWLRELKSPDKAEEIARFCDHWWLVAAYPDVVRDFEVPAGWGLLVAKGDQLKMITAAPAMKPATMSRQFLASLMRRATTAPKGAEYHQGVADGYAKAKQQAYMAPYKLRDQLDKIEATAKRIVEQLTAARAKEPAR